MNQIEQTQDVRPLKVLYQLLLDYLVSNGITEYFICIIIKEKLCTELKSITEKESEVLLLHFKSQRPTETLYKEIYEEEIYNKNVLESSWFIRLNWDSSQELIDIRIKLLKLIIATL